MNRTFVAVLMLVVVAVSVAAATPKKTARPIGTWTRDVSTTTWSIEVQQDCLTIKGITGDKIFTLKSPSYEISKEGILYGYIREMTWTDKDEVTSQLKVVAPFAFRLKEAKDNLALSDVRFFGADESTHQGLTGTFQKEANRNAAKPDSPAKELKR